MRALLVLLSLVFVRVAPKSTKTSAIPGAELCDCPPEFRPGQHGCYHLVADGSFESVQVACRSRGGQLISVTSQERDYEALVALVKNWRAMAWIGLRDESDWDEPDWRWTDGSPFNYSDWHQERGQGRCVVSWLHGGWQRRDCRLPAPGLCHHRRLSPPQPCAPPPAPLPGRQSHLPAGGDKWKLQPPPTELSLPPHESVRRFIERRMILKDMPAQWHQWI